MRFIDLTLEERIPVYMVLLESVIASAIQDVTAKPPTQEHIYSVMDSSLKQLTVFDIKWLFKYYHNADILRNTHNFLQSVATSSEDIEWNLIDKHEDMREEKSWPCISVKYMPSDILEALIMAIVAITAVEMYQAGKIAGSISPKEDAQDLAQTNIQNVLASFLYDQESFDYVTSVLDSNPETMEKVRQYLFQSSENEQIN